MESIAAPCTNSMELSVEFVEMSISDLFLPRHPSLDFPLVVTQVTTNFQRRHMSSSHFNLVSKLHSCHYLIGEIFSEPSEQDRYRMLLQAMTAARVGKYLTNADDARPFVAMAIYVTEHLVAERYLVAQLGNGQNVSEFI